MIISELGKLWEQRLEEYEASGKSIKAWCHKQSIRENQFYYWRKKLRSAQVEKPVKWLPLDLSSAAGSISVHVGQVTVEIKKGFDPHLFRQIVQALQTI